MSAEKAPGKATTETSARSKAPAEKAAAKKAAVTKKATATKTADAKTATATKTAAAKTTASKSPATKSPAEELTVGDRTVRLSNPDRVYFPATGATKRDLASYYLAVGEGIVRALRERPCMMHRYPEGLAGDKVHQKQTPKGAPDWVETVPVYFPRYRRIVHELCVTELAQVLWAVQMSTVEFHPWNSRRADVEKPDEWRIDLDPMPAAGFAKVRAVAHVAHEVLDELGITGYPKTTGGGGLHVYVRIRAEHDHGQVRRAALAFAREVERRAPDLVTTTWWRKDRDPSAVFVDYNQNARDHTIAAAYSVRGTPTATVSCPIEWAEIDDVQPADLTIATVPERFARLGDLHARIDDEAFDLAPLLEWAERDERAGLDAPPEPDDAGAEPAAQGPGDNGAEQDR